MLRLPRRQLAAAVAPERLERVLDSLVERGLVAAYAFDGTEVLLTGDFTRAEAVLDAIAHQEAPAGAEQVDAKTDYYLRAEEFTHSRSFRRLPPVSQAIWKLHAVGMSQQVIAVQLGVSPDRVRIAVRGARMAAELPRSTSAMPRGRPGLGRRCSSDGCTRRHHARGLCVGHARARWELEQVGCSAEACGNRALASGGLCWTHYNARRNG